MGFWDQMNSKNVDRRRSRNNVSSSRQKIPDEREESCCESEESPEELTLESLLSRWDMCEIDPNHPEWLQDPEFLQGFAQLQLMNVEALESFANAASKGNILAIAAMGDAAYRIFEFHTEGKRYRYGTDKYTDGLIKWAMSLYALAMMHEPYFEKMQERLLIFKRNFAHDDEFMSVIEEIGEKLNDFSFEHPEELREIFSL